jgi:NAD-dependent dihydropyrimidine dehydrogenase PreA subunit
MTLETLQKGKIPRKEINMAHQDEMYEKLRQLLSPKAPGFTPLPKHALTDQLLRSMYSEEEAQFLTTCLDKTWEKVTFQKAAELTGKSLEEIKALWADMVAKGKVPFDEENHVFLSAYLPGVFESYFTYEKDAPENMKLAAEAHVGLQKMAFMPGVELPFKGPSEFNPNAGWRFVPALEPTQKTIEINETLEPERQILPFEVLEKYLSKYDIFSVTQCSCRTAAKLAGEPCKRTDENFCLQAGPGAEAMLAAGVGQKLNFEEMMDHLKRASKAGLVHSTQNMQEPATFICNCCSCCCGVLTAIKNLKFKGAVANSNFTPMINPDLCSLCGTCEDMCPMEVIHSQEEAGQTRIAIDLDFCIGCGVCAANCPEEAITLEKTRNNIPVEKLPPFFG